MTFKMTRAIKSYAEKLKTGMIFSVIINVDFFFFE